MIKNLKSMEEMRKAIGFKPGETSNLNLTKERCKKA